MSYVQVELKIVVYMGNVATAADAIVGVLIGV